MKLNKQQAAFLIKNINQHATTENIKYSNFFYDDLIKIINQCTEKEFPESRTDLHLYTGDVPGCIILSNYGVEEGQRQIELRMKTSNKTDSWTTLFVEEFKQFATGVNAITAWLNERAEE